MKERLGCVVEKVRTYGMRGVLGYFLRFFSDKPLRLKLFFNALFHPMTPSTGVTVIGSLGGESSYSKILRDLVVKLHLCEIPYQTYNTAKTDAGMDDCFVKLLTPGKEFRVLRFSSIWGSFPKSLLRNRTDIAKLKTLFWEFETGAVQDNRGLLEEPGLLTMSHFSAQAFRRELPERVAVKEILYPFFFPDCPLLDRRTIRSNFSLDDSDFVVFFNFSLSSSYYRKNPEGAIRAFARAFLQMTNARLVFKIQGAKSHPEKVQRMRHLAAELGVGDRLTLISDFLPTDVLYALTAASDVYLSLHRGEGFGLGIAEAMSLGVPVVVANYSAPTEFCTEENAMLIPCVMRDVPPEEVDLPCYRFVKQWADADVDSAAMALKKLYDEPQLRRNIGERARKTMAKQFSSARFKQSVMALASVGR